MVNRRFSDGYGLRCGAIVAQKGGSHGGTVNTEMAQGGQAMQ